MFNLKVSFPTQLCKPLDGLLAILFDRGFERVGLIFQLFEIGQK